MSRQCQDVNNDGFNDVVIGESPEYSSTAGAAYVVFGSATFADIDLDVSPLDGTNGFKIEGSDSGDYAGTSVAGAGVSVLLVNVKCVVHVRPVLIWHTLPFLTRVVHANMALGAVNAFLGIAHTPHSFWNMVTFAYATLTLQHILFALVNGVALCTFCAGTSGCGGPINGNWHSFAEQPVVGAKKYHSTVAPPPHFWCQFLPLRNGSRFEKRLNTVVYFILAAR